MGRQAHMLAVPFPAQGHVTPLLKLCYQVASQGIKVTFVNTDFIHAKITAAMSHHEKEQTLLTLVSIPDGLEGDDDRKDIFKLSDRIRDVMPGCLANLMKKVNQSNQDEPITCMIADVSIGWVLDVAEWFGVEQAAFYPAGPSVMALLHEVPKLIKAGLIDGNGSLTKHEQIIISNEIPAWKQTELVWSVPGNLKIQKLILESCLTSKYAADRVKLLLFNTFYELDSASCDLIPNILTVGPMVSSANGKKSVSSGSFWLEDDSCLSWLDKQQTGSVVYVAFGSVAVFSQEQFEELALGLELSGKPFLWVVRSDLASGSPVYAYPEGFLDKAANHGKIVEWAPQEKVLAHPSVACFLSHCGWNSTIEGISHGVPFLCWPYFTDQFLNQNYICELWKVGLKLTPGINGIRSRKEICAKIEYLLSDNHLKGNVLKLKDLAQISIRKEGSSYRNLENFINHLKS